MRDSPPDSSTRPRARPVRRWIRRLAIAGATLVLLLGAAFVILTRPAVLKRLIEPQLSTAIGGPVSVRDVELDGWGSVRVGELSVRAEGWSGLAGEVIAASDVSVRFEPASLLRRSLTITSVALGELVIRVAERETDPGDFNLEALKPAPRAPAGGTPTSISIERLEFEMGVEGPRGWIESGHAALTGALKPVPASEGGDGALLEFHFREIGIKPDLARISGVIDMRTFALRARLDTLQLSPELTDLAPLTIREWVNRFSLVGEIRRAEVTWSPDAELAAELVFGAINLTIPEIDLEGQWSTVRDGRRIAREGLPRISVREGSVRLEGDQIRLEKITGELASNANDPGLVPVPVELSLTMNIDPTALRSIDWRDAAAREQWFAEVVDTAPLSIDVSINGFDSSEVPQGHPPVLEVPTPVAAVLETFGVTAWKLDVEASFRRAPPSIVDGKPVASPIELRGQAFLSDGVGAYTKFPYPLEDVRAHITFEGDDDEDHITVDYLTGRAPNGASIAIRGRIDDPGPTAQVDLHLSTRAAPIDARLIECFQGGLRAALELLFDSRAATGLEAAGLLPGAEVVERVRKELAQLYADDSGSHAGEIERLERLLEALPFTLGGVAALELDLRREAGLGNRLVVTGDIDIQRGGVLVARFPYPLMVTSGSLHLEPDTVMLAGDGVRAVTPAGGIVRVTGALETRTFADGSRRLEPNLTIVGVHDRVSPNLLAAIPPSHGSELEGWPGRTLSVPAQLLNDAELAGALDYSGRVTADDEGHPQFLLEVSLADGSVRVRDREEGGFGLPEGLELRELSSLVRVGEDAIEIDRLEARGVGRTGQPLGRMYATGKFSTHDRSREISLSAADFPLGPWVPDLVEGAAREGLARVWRQLDPSGIVDATLTVRDDAEGLTDARAVIKPLRFEAMLDGERSSLANPQGRIEIDVASDHPTIVLDEVGGDVRTDDENDGRWIADGRVIGFDPARNRSVRFDGEVTVTAARIDAPLPREIVARFVPADLVPAWRALALRGRTDARARLGERAADGAWEFDARPSEVGGEIFGTSVDLALEPGAAISASGAGLRVDGVRGATHGGTLMLGANADFTTSPCRATATYALVADSLTDEVIALLPPPLRQARDAVDFTSASLALDDVTMTLEWDPHEGGLSDPIRYTLDARGVSDDAEFHAGVPVTKADGSAEIRFAYERRDPASPPRLSLDAQFWGRTLLAFDRPVQDGTVRLTLSPDGSRLEVHDLIGTLASGRVAGQGSYEIATDRYAADLLLAGASFGQLADPEADPSADVGTVEGAVSVAGTAGDIASRVGRGRITVRGASMSDSQLTLRLLQLTQLALPFNASVRLGDIRFYIDGPTAHMERFDLHCDGLDLLGVGRLNIETLALDATFRPRGRLGPVSDIIGFVSDQIYEIRVGGTLTRPAASLRPLPGLGRAAAAMMSGGADTEPQ